MSDVERLLDELLGSRRLRESAAFTTHTYSDRPIIQTGRQMREREARKRAELNAGPDTTPRPGASSSAPSPHGQTARGSRPHPHVAQQQLPYWQEAQEGGTAPRTIEVSPAQAPLPRTRAAEADQGTTTNIPERYYQLRELAGGQAQTGSSSWRGALAYGTRSANRLFYEQARLMEDFEDSYEFSGSYFQYFPTYSSMTLSQLRGYFSWRTDVRHGQVGEAPLSFAFVYVYELLCGIGTTPGEQGLADLEAFRKAFGSTASAHGTTFHSYLRRWLRDYVVYHGLDPALLPEAPQGTQAHMLTLLQAEEATLARQGLERREGALPQAGTPSDEELLAALNACSSYQPCGARLYKTNPDDLSFVACEVFRGLVTHCGRRRKTDYVEGLFGGPSTELYTMFSSAVFYEPERHPDATVHLSGVETFTCRDGRWRHHLLCQPGSRSSELGLVMHAVDARLRTRLDYPYPLKDRPVQAYVGKIVDKAIDTLMARKAEEKRRRIRIDLSQLAGIRAAAAVTQEALLTDEERDEAPGAMPAQGVAEARDAMSAQGTGEPHAPGGTAMPRPTPPAAPKPASGQPAPAQGQVAPQGQGLGLSPTEDSLLRALLAGTSAAEALERGQMLSLVVDSLNEKLFDLVGDAVIEYEGDEPALVEDYVEDVREILGA